MDRIKLLNGTEYEANWVGAGNALSAEIVTDDDFADVAAELDNPENTRKITHYYADKSKEHDGFVVLRVIQRTGDNTFMFLLEGERK